MNSDRDSKRVSRDTGVCIVSYMDNRMEVGWNVYRIEEVVNAFRFARNELVRAVEEERNILETILID